MSGKSLYRSMLFVLLFQSFGICAKNKQDDITVPEDVKKLLVSLHSLCDKVMQKATSSKDSEELVKSWNKQELYHQMRRDIMSLNRKRYIQKLKHSQDSEERDLHARLKELYRELVKYDKELEYVDPLSNQSRKQSLKHLKKTQELLTMLEKHIEGLMPAIKTFLQKHDDETKQLAQQANQQQQQAFIDAQEAAQQKEQPVQVPEQKQEVIVQQPKEEPKEQPTADIDVAQALQSHVQLFPLQHEQNFITFLQSIGTKYPLAREAQPKPYNPLMEENWLYSKDKYKGQGFDDYQRTILQNSQTFAVELDDMKKLFNIVEDTIQSIPIDKLANVSNDQNYQLLSSRIQKYKKASQGASDTIQNKFHENIDTSISPILDPLHIADYKTQHNIVRKTLLDTFYNPILQNEHAMDTINKKLNNIKFSN